MSLLTDIVRECLPCKHIAQVYMRHDEKSLVFQLVIGRKSTPEGKGFMRIEPVYTLKLEAVTEVRKVVKTILQAHPEVESQTVPYVFHPGANWTVAYARSGPL